MTSSNQDVDPTQSPPRTGSLVHVLRVRTDRTDALRVHQQGVVSYRSWRTSGPREEPVAEHFRVLTDLLRWRAVLAQLPRESDDPLGPDGAWASPVRVDVETPQDFERCLFLETSRAHPFVTLVLGWMDALGADPAALPPGLGVLQRPST